MELSETRPEGKFQVTELQAPRRLWNTVLSTFLLDTMRYMEFLYYGFFPRGTGLPQVLENMIHLTWAKP